MATVLVTGGAGYIGSHTGVELLASGHEVLVVDNLCNSRKESLERVARIAGRPVKAFYRSDVRDRDAMREIFRSHPVDAVVHFAALKAVGESVADPLRYYDNNIVGTIALAEVMAECGVTRLVFSSSATVYGDPARVPIREDFPTSATNPYGWSKWMMERVLTDVAAADDRWRVVLLRYFNPVGAHPSGLIGEDPAGIPNNLMPFVTQVALGLRDSLQVFGDDYPTRDGTGVRDYIHVVDLAKGHVKAIERLDGLGPTTCVNLGTGRGYSVLELVRAVERAAGKPVPYRIVDRRAGDVAECWADPTLAQSLLGWRAERGLEEMCEDAWRWQSMNPRGFTT